MNKPCLKCGSIMMVPDIPLPKTYTQKCVSCGFVNPVGDELYYGPSDDHDSKSDSETDVFHSDDSKPEVASFDINDSAHESESSDDWLARLNDVKGMRVALDMPTEDEIGSDALDQLKTRPLRTESQHNSQPARSGPVAINYETMKPYLEIVKKELRQEFTEKLAQLEATIATRSSMPQSTMADEVNNDRKDEQIVMREALVERGLALVCSQVPRITETATAALNQAQFRVQHAASIDDANRAIQEIAFQVIVFEQRFVQGSPEGQGVLNTVKNIALPIRRHQSVVLLTPRIETAESQVFYQWGVDMNVHADDLTELGSLVRQLVELKQDMLKVYLNSSLDTDRVVI